MTRFNVLDAIAFIVYMALLIGVGVWFTRQQKDLKSYLLADRGVNAIVVGISVIAALFSGVTYLGAPAETYTNGLGYMLTLAAYLIATPITALLFVPYFYRLGLYTVYEYLETRFDGRMRRLASFLFLLRVTAWIATAIYAPALAISASTGWPIWGAILFAGAATTFYTTLGGMKAVIWTDTVQFCLLCLGICLVICCVGHQTSGGLTHAWELAAADGRTRILDFRLDPHLRVTFWAALIGGAAASLVQMVTDQISVQRYMTAKSLKEAQKALWIKLWIMLPLVALVYLAGIFLYGYYKANPALTPVLERTDEILPYFIRTTLPPPLPGLLLASIFASTMSAAAAGLNSLTTAILIDFGRGISIGHEEAGTPEGNRRQVRSARLITTALGIVTTVLALFMGRIGTLVEGPGKISSVLGGPLLGVFFLGVCSPKTGGLAALIAMIIGTGAVIAAQAASFSFLWLSFLGASTTYAAGWLLARCMPAAAHADAAQQPQKKRTGAGLPSTEETAA